MPRRTSKSDTSRQVAESSDSDDDTATGPITNATNGFAKLRVGELPTIRDITIINSTNFSGKKVELGEEVESGGVSRVAINYRFDEGEKGLCLTCPKDPTAFFRCNGVEEETYAKKGSTKRTGTGKNVMKLHLDINNEQHEAFRDVLATICAAVKKKIEKANGKKKVAVKIRGLYNLIDNDKNVTGYVLAARLIESATGAVYTAAYNDEEQVDVKAIGRCDVRPGIIFSYSVPDDGVSYSISVSLAQVYYKPRSIFPLRDVE